MAKYSLDFAMQDESYFFKFLLENPRHGVVLNLIAGALKRYHAKLHTAVYQHNTGAQQDIALVTRFLKDEAQTRVAILHETFNVTCFERLFGEAALAELLDRQTSVVADLQQGAVGLNGVERAYDYLFECGGQSPAPSWGTEFGRANLNQIVRVRLIKHEIFGLSREMHQLYHSGKRQDSWHMKVRVDSAGKRLTQLNIIDDATRIGRIIKDMYGADELRRVLDWVRANTRLLEFEALRNQIKATRFNGRIFVRSNRQDSHKVG